MTARTLIAAAVFVCAGCSQTRHYHEARPVTATLEINVEGQWRLIQRTVYEYEEKSHEETDEQATDQDD